MRAGEQAGDIQRDMIHHRTCLPGRVGHEVLQPFIVSTRNSLFHAFHVFSAVAGLHQAVKVNTRVSRAVVGRGAEQRSRTVAKGGKALCDGKKRSRRRVIFRRQGCLRAASIARLQQEPSSLLLNLVYQLRPAKP